MTIRLKITLWFSVLLIAIVAMTYAVVLSAGSSSMLHSIEENLKKAVGDNAAEVELTQHDDEEDDEERYLPYGGGALKIDDDYKASVNGVTSLIYGEDGTLLYGEEPVQVSLPFSENKVQKKTIGGTRWYVFDQKLTYDGGQGLWIRGIISAQPETAQLSSTIRLSMVAMPLLLLVAIAGGYLLAGRMLRPVKQIADTAAHITRGSDLKKRIDIGEGKDELHCLAASFNEMIDRLDGAFETEKQFASDASHELRTPMSVILAQCEYTLEEERSGEEYAGALRVIRRQGAKMARLIDDMLTFTRLERKADSIEMKKLDFSALAQSVSEDMALLREKEITLTAAIEPGIFVWGSAPLLGRLLGNLIGNAYRYGRENGHITVSIHSQNDEAVLSVADDGIGIAKENQARIFQRFYQVNDARGGGTGLGLSMVQEIARLHGAAVSLESKAGEGSNFFVTFKKA